MIRRNSSSGRACRTDLGGIERGPRRVSLANTERVTKALTLKPSELFRLVEGS